MLSLLIFYIRDKYVGAQSSINRYGVTLFIINTFIIPILCWCFAAFVLSLVYKFFAEGHLLDLLNRILKVFNYIMSWFSVSETQISTTSEPDLSSSNELKTSSNSSISKKKIIIGVTIGAIVVCGVGAGIFFIPGAPELIISTVLFCSKNGGFGGA